MKTKYHDEEELISHYNKNPNYLSPIRKNNFKKLISKFVPNIKNPSILDLGCGSGKLIPFLDNKFSDYSYAGVDYSLERINLAKSSFADKRDFFFHQDLNFFVENINQKFDIIFAIEVLEHLSNPGEVIGNSLKLLKKDGIIIGSIPLNFPYKAHLQVYNSIEDAKNKLIFDEHIDAGKFVIAKWKN